jgi:ornithine carbamoyltransferase
MKRDFLRVNDLSADEFRALLDFAVRLKTKTRAGEPHPLLAGKTMAMIFQKPSLRTRVSFETGMYQLGGHAIYLAPADIGFGQREAIQDIAQVIARFNQIIMARVFGHEDVEALARHAPVPVVNALSADSHPCQVAADILTIYEKKNGKIDGIKVVYAGDGNNVANSWIELAHILPFRLVIACPEGYEPSAALLASARQAGVSEVTIARDVTESVRGADVVYTDVWASMGQEEEAEKRKRIFPAFQINARVMREAGPQAYFMHDLPAHRGDEVTDEVMDGPQSIIYDQAENRLHAQKAILATLLGAAG